MPYQSPFLRQLEDDEEQRRFNLKRGDDRRKEEDRRVQSSIELMTEAPLTLRKMMNEDIDRRQRLKESEFNMDDRKKKFDRDVFETDRTRSDTMTEKERLRNLERGNSLAENAVFTRMYVPGANQKQRVQIPVEQDVLIPSGGPPPMTGESADFHKQIAGGMGGVDPFMPESAPLIKTKMPVKNAVPLTPGHAHVAKTGLPERETLLEQSSPGDMAMAQAIFNQDREIFERAGMKVEDVAANIARNRIKDDTKAHKDALDHDKLALQKLQLEQRARLDAAKIAKLNRPPREKAEKDWPVSLSVDERKYLRDNTADRYNIRKQREKLMQDPEFFGTVQGFVQQLKGFLKVRDYTGAENFVNMARLRDSRIKSLSGATVTDQEMNRVIQGLPTQYDDAKTMDVFLSALDDELENSYRNVIEIGDFGKRAPTALKDRELPGDAPKGVKQKQTGAAKAGGISPEAAHKFESMMKAMGY